MPGIFMQKLFNYKIRERNEKEEKVQLYYDHIVIYFQS